LIATPPAVVATVSVEPARAALLGAIDAGALGFTLCEIGNGVRMITPPVAGVAAFLVLGGTLKLHSDSGDTRARSGQLVLVPAGWATQLSPAGTAPQDRVVDGAAIAARRQGWLVADARHDGEAAVTVAAGRVGGTTQATLSAPMVLTLATDRCARQALALLRNEVADPLAGSMALAEAMLSACIVYAVRAASSGNLLASADATAPLARAVARVVASPGADHSVDSLAQAAGMSRSTFSRHFTATYGTGPMDFVLGQRLGEAATLLRSTSLPVKAVAASVGFVSRSYFSRAFRAKFGVDPTAYRVIP
jgi:AraC-like DNA-binding protein